MIIHNTDIKAIEADLEAFEEQSDMTADELAYERYKRGEYAYEDYLAVCSTEETEPLPRIG